MANHLLPQLTSNYTSVLADLHARIDDSLKGLDPAIVTATNVPTNSIRWTSAGNTWQKWNGTSWANLATTYSISISGNAATATALATARNIGGVSFNGTANINLPGVNTTGNQNTTGNAATATALATARTIGGVSFNGTANINLPGVNTTGNQNTTGSASGISTTSWTITEIGGKIVFSHSGVPKASLDSNGNFNVVGEVVADGTV